MYRLQISEKIDLFSLGEKKGKLRHVNSCIWYCTSRWCGIILSIFSNPYWLVMYCIGQDWNKKWKR